MTTRRNWRPRRSPESAAYAGNPAAFDRLTELEQYFRTVHKPYGWLSDATWQHLAETSGGRLPDGRLTPHYDPCGPRVVEIAGCGHAPALNTPDQLRLIEIFMRE